MRIIKSRYTSNCIKTNPRLINSPTAAAVAVLRIFCDVSVCRDTRPCCNVNAAPEILWQATRYSLDLVNDEKEIEMSKVDISRIDAFLDSIWFILERALGIGDIYVSFFINASTESNSIVWTTYNFCHKTHDWFFYRLQTSWPVFNASMQF